MSSPRSPPQERWVSGDAQRETLDKYIDNDSLESNFGGKHAEYPTPGADSFEECIVNAVGDGARPPYDCDAPDPFTEWADGPKWRREVVEEES